MAAMASFSLLRNYAVTARAFSNLNTPQTVFRDFVNYKRSLIPLQSRRSLSRVGATNNEEAAAKAAAVNADSGTPTIFDKIIAKEISSTIVYEDEKVLAFRDINPQAPVHVLIIPKLRDGLTMLGKVSVYHCYFSRLKNSPIAEARHGEILSHLLYTAKIVAEKEGILDGFRVVINNGPDACQSVYHLHLHVLGGRQMKWPPG
ncbi:hypothetical protein EZV62_027591 [Acer yangbiense]|uniref:HIT domain-containing protein n=1 Tax=Acer yangbiense TaxID=1000413 RepID=A0A5C7GV17_9ROSI|nr:hypothetical protein EZV62_027591 [Acer yangbiense]